MASREPDAALGNGGLGRLAACFLDSMATLGLPSFGYGIRYEYGMFAQEIQNGSQVEYPDPWLSNGTPWEFPRSGLSYPVRFGGWVEHVGSKAIWRSAGEVAAKAHDMVVPGHGTEKVSTLRLWKAVAPEHIDLHAFNTGDYARAAGVKNEYENISWVLYPNDSTPAGRELRLRQEYFFVAASVQDILGRHLAEHGTLSNLADKVAIHLNDTHPAIGVAELMRLLVRRTRACPGPMPGRSAGKVFSYTNHTLMPEALETWPVGLMQHVLPRHLEIIFRINQEFLDFAAKQRPGDLGFLSRLSLIDEHGERRVRMANLSIVGSHKVNGVSALHSDLLVQTIFADFASLWPERFTNMTNGVTPRRWLAQANPGLAGLLDRTLGERWRLDLDQLRQLKEHGTKAALPQRIHGRQARQQGAPGRAHQARHRHRGRSVQPVRRAGQAHPRIQAPVAQRAARGDALPGHPGQPRRRLGAAHGDLRRQGGVGLPHGQEHHPAHPRCGQRHQQRSAWWPAG